MHEKLKITENNKSPPVYSECYKTNIDNVLIEIQKLMLVKKILILKRKNGNKKIYS